MYISLTVSHRVEMYVDFYIYVYVYICCVYIYMGCVFLYISLVACTCKFILCVYIRLTVSYRLNMCVDFHIYVYLCFVCTYIYVVYVCTFHQFVWKFKMISYMYPRLTLSYRVDMYVDFSSHKGLLSVSLSRVCLSLVCVSLSRVCLSLSCVSLSLVVCVSLPPAPMNHVKTFKGWPLQDTPSMLVKLGILEGPALKCFYMIHRGGRDESCKNI